MDLNFTIINIIILFGGIQGFTLCWYLYKKRKPNPTAASFFIFFIFCLAFHNLIYAAIDMDFHNIWTPVAMFPFPYKYLLGVALYFYVKHHFKNEHGPKYHLKEWYLFVPAIIYLGFRSVWFYISVSEDSTRIVRTLVDKHVFDVNEFVILTFSITLSVLALRFLKAHKDAVGNQPKNQRKYAWLRQLTIIYLCVNALNAIVFIANLVLNEGISMRCLYYPSLVLNSAFIYWLGYIGFSKSDVLFSVFKLNQTQELDEKSNAIKQHLEEAMKVRELYKNPNLTLAELATELDLSPKDISGYINDVLNMNFSEYLSKHRVEKVKELLSSDQSQKFTLLALAEEAGFSSKSSFNATFKRLVGQTPSEYRKSLN